MKLPNGHVAVVDTAKLLDYCLSNVHPYGRHKARLFARVLGIENHHAGLLEAALCDAARTKEVMRGRRDMYGDRFILDFQMEGPGGTGWVRSHWIVRRGEQDPRLVTCYVMRRRP